jgi:hypothetical protein
MNLKLMILFYDATNVALYGTRRFVQKSRRCFYFRQQSSYEENTIVSPEDGGETSMKDIGCTW